MKGREILGAGAVEDALDGLFELDELDQEVTPFGRPRGVEEFGEAVGEEGEGVTARRMAVQIVNGEEIELFFADGVAAARQQALERFQQACEIGVVIDTEALGGSLVLSSRDDGGDFRGIVSETRGMRDGAEHPALQFVERHFGRHSESAVMRCAG